MKDELREHGSRDRNRVEDEESWELRWLSQELGVNYDELDDVLRHARLVVSRFQQHLGHY